jgi:hypothetical protein
MCVAFWRMRVRKSVFPVTRWPLSRMTIWLQVDVHGVWRIRRVQAAGGSALRFTGYQTQTPTPHCHAYGFVFLLAIPDV